MAATPDLEFKGSVSGILDERTTRPRRSKGKAATGKALNGPRPVRKGCNEPSEADVVKGNATTEKTSAVSPMPIDPHDSQAVVSTPYEEVVERQSYGSCSNDQDRNVTNTQQELAIDVSTPMPIDPQESQAVVSTFHEEIDPQESQAVVSTLHEEVVERQSYGSPTNDQDRNVTNTQQDLAIDTSTDEDTATAESDFVINQNLEVANKFLSRFKTARSGYHETVIKEQRVFAQIAYDSGNMTGVLNAFMKSAEATAQLARFKDRAGTPHEGFVAVASRMEDLFAAFGGMLRFDPDPEAMDDGPSVEFAQARIRSAKRKYQVALNELVSQQPNMDDPDVPLLNNKKFFGKMN
ncbi:hypothetical protein PHYSODRAFT_294819 [Phytophthora sojae]|uniref:Uncharacterized protein n=1 Tax=Phytophthora sojae (strain P6497) TaxID=1094619 RepID=G4YN36_PHYSP|nr:hypothetical protein PHYSODRAFT_294819 [Phytophthora sojae]EGZ29831.1 hypothetical protein PHYSODRAFT_294819 [Phytophthora sojae]|eukprot:XP_009517106.1 hypothetical protein PHYSODRAFT_294819 [Phytophthora sojae]